MFGTIDNSDIVGHTYQGFEGYVVADARVNYQLNRNLQLAVGVDNLTDRRYFLFHPFLAGPSPPNSTGISPKDL